MRSKMQEDRRMDPDEMLARAEQGLRLARSLDADGAEIYLWYGQTRKLQQSQEDRTLEESDRSGVSVRLLKDGRFTSAKTSGLQAAEIGWAVRRASRSASLVPPQESFERFAGPMQVDRGPSKVHPDLVHTEPRRLRDLGDQIQDAAYSAGEPNYFSARIHSKLGLFAVANTEGVRAWDHHAHESFRFEVRCNKGENHKFASALGSGRQPIQEGRDLELEAQAAVERAQAATETAELDGYVDEMILDGVCSLLLLGKVLPSLAGRAADQGRSVFADKLDERVASESLTILDRPFGPGGTRHQRVDDEGIPTQETPLIQDGILRNFLYDWRAAQEGDHEPTGHGLRGLSDRYAGLPSARPVNPVVEPGDRTLGEMVEEAGDAVLVRDAMLGSFTMDRLSGEFSFVAPLAFHVEDGEVQEALAPTSVSGNLFEALHQIRALGSEQKDYPGGAFVPIHLAGVTCAT